MNDQRDFEARLATAFAAYADRAPVEVDPMSITRPVARRRSGPAWPTLSRRASWLVAGVALALLALGAALVAGSSLLRPHTSIGGGGPLLINEADWPGSDATRQVNLHVFSLDEATGDRLPIVDLPSTGRSYGSMSAVWSPDHTHALLTDAGGSVRGIVDVASERVSPIQLKPTDTYISLADWSPWAQGSDRIASIVSNDTTNTQGSILISDLNGREVGRLPVPPGWLAGRPVWSPDGVSLILSGCPVSCADGANDENLLLVPLDGSPMRVLLEPGQGYFSVTWSPDGSTIVFESSVGIQTMDVATGHQIVVTRGNDRQPTWSPDGRRIAFVRLDAQGTNGAIEVVDVDGNNLLQLTSANDAAPAWSPDGTMVVFSRRTGIYSDVWVVGADGAAPHLLVRNAVSDW
jgi:WD40 repeat protein